MFQDEDYYKQLRNRFLPQNLKVIFIAESPPEGGKYFYNPEGSKGELLFRMMMKFINYSPKDKLDGLEQFKNKGYFLVDSIYSPVNQVKNQFEKNRLIVSNLMNVINDLEKIIKNRRVKLIPVKLNVCKIITGPLESLGFKVLNVQLPFPDASQQRIFFEKLNCLKREYSLP